MHTLSSRLCLSLAFAGLALAPVTAQAQTYTLTDLGVLPGGTSGIGFAVNNSGQVTGDDQLPPNQSHVFVSGPNGGALRDLGTLPGGGAIYGEGINDTGQVA